jgi:hypothetical protein
MMLQNQLVQLEARFKKIPTTEIVWHALAFWGVTIPMDQLVLSATTRHQEELLPAPVV